MIIRKWFGVNFKREEAWIEKLTNQGYRLTSVSLFRYEFKPCESEEKAPKVKIDFRTFQKEEDFVDYLTMFEDSGWRHIAGTKSNGVQYFEQMDVNSSEDIFSDIESKAGRYRRMSKLWLSFFYAYFPILVLFSIMGIFDFGKMLHLKELYYTPGLWEKTGISFWRAFLFETPFALGRGGIFGLIFLFIIIMYIYYALKSMYLYKKEKSIIKKDL